MEIDKDVLYRYFANLSTEEEEIQIRAYIESSERNWQNYLRERKLFDATIASGRANLRAGTKLRKRPHTLWKETLKVAAILAIAVFASWLWLEGGDGAGGISMVSTSNGQMAQVVLPDGTKVNLNANTRLEYPVRFVEGERRVKVEGEAYFDVMPDKQRPFVVKTSRAEVCVLGTKFYVEDYAGSSCSRVSLIQGSVEVTAGGHKALLSPCQLVTIANDRMDIRTIEDFDPYRWSEGLICVKNQSMRQLTETFKKYFGVSIILSSGWQDDVRITGKFHISDGVEHALKVLQKQFSFTYTRDDDRNVIVVH